VAVEVQLSNGVRAEAKVPSGASTGSHEAVELRDSEVLRFAGRGVRRAVSSVTQTLGPAIHGMNAEDQCAIDRRLCEVDGTPNKRRLGANAILGVSCAVARAVAAAQDIPLWQYLAAGREPSLPMPMVNIISGGLHAGKQFEFQDFMIIPKSAGSFSDALRAAVYIHAAARKTLVEHGYTLTGIADEGGWGPRLPNNGLAFEILMRAIERAGYRPGHDVSIALDVAATHFYHRWAYRLYSEDRELTASDMIGLLAHWADRYPLVSIEDGLHEDDWKGWTELTQRLGSRMQLVGDDFFVTNLARLEQGIRRHAGNAVLVKMNQIGTLTETFAVIDRAREAGWPAVISARSGETEDDFLADLAVASGAGQIKIGSVRGSERLAKYNRLLRIESSGLPMAHPFPA
jgi:enolase